MICWDAQRSERVRTLLFAGLFTVGLMVSIAVPALAGSAGFNNTGSMNVAWANHTATLLANGEVLVAGGADNSGTALTSAELAAWLRAAVFYMGDC